MPRPGASSTRWSRWAPLGRARTPLRAAFFLVNDLALILLSNQIAMAIGVDPLTPEGIDRWAREVSTIYAEGAFSAPRKE